MIKELLLLLLLLPLQKAPVGNILPAVQYIVFFYS